VVLPCRPAWRIGVATVTSCGQAADAIREFTDARITPAADAPGMYYSDHMDGTDWIGMGLMVVFTVIILLVVIWAIAQWNRGTDRGMPPADKSARDILDERFARGEIEKDEYEVKRRALHHPPVG
jgi:putative membrane protein